MIINFDSENWFWKLRSTAVPSAHTVITNPALFHC